MKTNYRENKKWNCLQKPKWLEEFDKLTHHYEPIPNSKGRIIPFVKRDEVIHFITERQQEIKEAVQQERERVIEIMQSKKKGEWKRTDNDDFQAGESLGLIDGWNSALDEVIKKIKL